MTKQERSAYNKAYWQTHRAEKAAYAKVHYQTHKAEIAAKKTAHYQAHKAELVAKKTAHYQLHKTEITAKKAAYYRAHKAELVARVTAWQQANPDKCADNWARRRARKAGATVERVSRAVVFERDGGRCHLCGKKVGKNWHLDHIIPLARGGKHSYKNVAVSCSKCNLVKGIKPVGQLRLY